MNTSTILQELTANLNVSCLTTEQRSKIYSIAEQVAVYELENIQQLNSSTKTMEFLINAKRRTTREHLGCLFLNAKHCLIHQEVMFKGTTTSSSVFPKEIAKKALLHNAFSVIIYHNHPSGGCEPSQSDKNITVAIKSALTTVDVALVDHFVLGKAAGYSFADHGLI